MTALALLIGLAGLGSGCATGEAGLSVRQERNLVFGPSIFGIGPADTYRAPWPVTDAPPEPVYSYTEVRDIQYGTDRPRNSYYRRFESVQGRR